MSLNMDKVFDKLGASVNKVEKDIETFLNKMDSSNTADVMKLQKLMQKWSIATQVQSNTLKNIGDGIKSTVANMR